MVHDALTMAPASGPGPGDAAHPAAGGRRRRPRAGAHRRVPRGLRSRSSWSASRRSTTAAPRRPGPSADDDGHVADAAGRRAGAPAEHRHGRSASRAARRAARHVLAKGERAFCALSWAERPGRARPTSTTPRRASSDTVAFWRSWLARARIPDHPLRHPIERSALTIKGLTYMPTGATVAALTTSLPETPGGERNWDYRYTWMRDTTFTLQALHYLNLDWEADEFMQFVADLEPNPDGGLQIMYGIDGRRDLTESTRDELSGYEGARPVRHRQRRLRPAPERRLRRGARLAPAAHPAQQAPAPAAVAAGEVAGRGRHRRRGASPTRASGRPAGQPQHYVSSKLMGWVALDRAAKLAGDPRRPRARAGVGRPPPRRSRRTSSRTASATGACCASTTTPTRWTPRPCSPPIFGFLPGTDERMRNTVDRDRRGAHRERLRAALRHRRDRRRAVRQGGHLPDLLVLAGLGARHRRRDAARPPT